jgi:hypothetical protein
VLHAFNKKSTRGEKTPVRLLQIVKTRLREAKRISAEWRAQQANAGDIPSSQKRFLRAR